MYNSHTPRVNQVRNEMKRAGERQREVKYGESPRQSQTVPNLQGGRERKVFQAREEKPWFGVFQMNWEMCE